MTTSKVAVRLQYRPSADILTGTTDLSHPLLVGSKLDDTRIDSDTELTIALPSAGPFVGIQILESFSLIGARKRYSTGRPDFLSAKVWKVARGLFDSVAVQSVPLELAVAAKAEARISVDIDELVVGERPAPSDLADVGSARSLASTLRQLGSALRDAGTSAEVAGVSAGNPNGDPNGRDDTGRLVAPSKFVMQLEHLASAVAAHRQPVPSITSSLRSNLRGGLPLTEGERKRVRRALGMIDDTGRWRDASKELSAIADGIGGITKNPTDDLHEDDE